MTKDYKNCKCQGYQYEDYKKIIEEHLLDYMPKELGKGSTLSKAMEYSLTAGGKRIRPVLLLAACNMAGGYIEKAIPYACAVEYIHTYSLIHDDLPAMDDDDLRRGKPTSHKVFGEAMAILAGDGLLSQAFQIMAEDIKRSLEEVKDKQNDFPEFEAPTLSDKINAQEVIVRGAGCVGMIEGQVLDIEGESKKIYGQELEHIHNLKTGALILASIKAGLLLAGANAEITEDFSKFALKFGLAFQIHDDILDAIGTTDSLGKPAGSDQDLDKSTYVSIYGLQGAKAKLNETLDDAINQIAKYEKAKFFIGLINQLKDREN